MRATSFQESKMRVRNNNKQITFRLPDNLLTEIHRTSKKMNQSKASIIKTSVIAYLKRNQKASANENQIQE